MVCGEQKQQNMFADIFCKRDEIQYISHTKVTRNIPLCMLLRELSVLQPPCNLTFDLKMFHTDVSKQTPYSFHNMNTFSIAHCL